VGRETIKLHGHSHVREQIAGLTFLVSPTAFFQTNALAAATLVDMVLAEAPAASSLRVADLYAGSGLFTLVLAARGHLVTAVEESAQAVEDGRANARLNRLDDRVRFICGRVEAVLPRLAKLGADLAIIDPPRAGCPPAVLAMLLDQRPPLLLYISCNPEALARELPAIIAAGYTVRRVQPLDMFPHTTHIETVVSLAAEGAERRQSVRDKYVVAPYR
jgi:23S rRNA (uracil1939-C5)-methyltransferase